MPLPLLWLGVAAASTFALNRLVDDRKKQQARRRHNNKVQRFADLQAHESPIGIYPTDIFSTEQKVMPQFGALVCCGIGGILDHSGIWVDDNTIIELDGEGLIKPISAKRFIQERSGKAIFIACDSQAQPLISKLAGERAIAQIFQCRDYHVIDNNCHQFTWQCFQPNDASLTTFKELNLRFAQLFDRKIYWDLCDGKF